MLAGSIANAKLLTLNTPLLVSNSATTATNLNNANAIVARDADGNFSAGTITANLTGNASTVTTIPVLTGDVSSVGNATTIGALKVTNAMLAGSIANAKLAQITTANCVANSATTATNLNNANAIVARDASKNFSAGTITACLNGNASTVTTIPALTGDVCSGGANNLVTTIANGAVTNAMLAGSIANIKLAQITTANCVANSATTATKLNTANAIVCRDAGKNFSAGTITACLNGNASTVTTIPALTGDVCSGGANNLVTTIGNLCVTNAMLHGGITNDKTTATKLNTANAIVCRDASKNFSAGTITATLSGNALTVTTIPALTGHVTSSGTSNVTTIANGVVTNAMLAAGSISPSKTTATRSNTANTIVCRPSNTNIFSGSPPVISSIEIEPSFYAPTSPTMGTVYIKCINDQFQTKTLMIYTCFQNQISYENQAGFYPLFTFNTW
jgi:trimeric autotransporter adhesin